MVAVLALVVLAVAVMVWHERLEFPYDGPDGAVAPGAKVTIRDPDGDCGPLLVTIWRPSILRQWNQTHSGDAVNDSFAPDHHPWWRFWESTTTFTPVPCAIGGMITMTIPEELEPGDIALCDSSRKCARLEIADDP